MAYINQDEFIAQIKRQMRTLGNLTFSFYVIIRMIEKQPAADVRENTYARWITIVEKSFNRRTNSYELIQTKYRCTRCGTIERDKWEYCRCGAVMVNGNCHPLCNTGDRR